MKCAKKIFDALRESIDAPARYDFFENDQRVIEC